MPRLKSLYEQVNITRENPDVYLMRESNRCRLCQGVCVFRKTIGAYQGKRYRRSCAVFGYGVR